MNTWLLAATFAWPIPPGQNARPLPLCPPCECTTPRARAAPAVAPAPELEPEPDWPITARRIAPPVDAPMQWYGGPAVVADVLSFAMIGGGGSANNGELFLLGTAGFALGGPINHLAHGHPGRALASLGIRVLGGGMATGAVLLEVLSHPCDGEASCHHSPALGLAAGAAILLATMAVDDAVLPYEPRAPGAFRPSRASLAPALVVAPNLAFASLGGRF
jgi:hypothetical protein